MHLLILLITFLKISLKIITPVGLSILVYKTSKKLARISGNPIFLQSDPNQIIEYYDELSIAGWFVLAIGLIFFLTGYYLLFEIIKGRKNVCL